MNRLFILAIILLSAPHPFLAQEGKYVKKAEEQTETLTLLPDNTYTHDIKTKWANTHCSGTWKAKGKKKLILNSNYQINDFEVEERVLEGIKGRARIIIGGAGKDQSPRKIKGVYLNVNGQDSIYCPMDTESTLAAFEARQKKQLSSSSKQKQQQLTDSGRKHFYLSEEVPEVKLIRIYFDYNRAIEYTPENKEANEFELIMKLAKDPLYVYLEEEAFSWEKKTLTKLSSQEKFKKTKK